MSRGREAWQQLAASYYAFDGFPELMFVFFFCGPFSEARLTPSILWSLHQKQPGSRARSLHFPLVFLPEKRTEKAPPLPRSSAIAGALCGRDRKECRKGPRQIRTPSNVCLRVLCASIKTWNRNVYGIPTALLKKSVSTPRFTEARSQH